MFSFKGKNIIVTGGSRGIGAACVRMFRELGANVAFNYNKNFRAADSLKESCSKFDGETLFYECDVSDYQEVQQFLNKIIDRFGKIDALVNNAGIWEYGQIENMSVDAWRRTLQINLDSVFYFSQLIVKHMKEHQIKGRIINISSTAGQRGEAFHSTCWSHSAFAPTVNVRDSPASIVSWANRDADVRVRSWSVIHELSDM